MLVNIPAAFAGFVISMYVKLPNNAIASSVAPGPMFIIAIF